VNIWLQAIKNNKHQFMYKDPEPPNEALACLDEKGNAIESHTREEVHQEPVRYWHAVVNVWLLDKTAQMLCSLRSKTLSGNPNKWQTYFGGHVGFSNTFKEAAVIEMEEEVGLKIDPSKLFLIKAGKWEPSKHFFESYVYPFNDSLDVLKFNDGEIVKANWFSFEKYNLDRQNNPGKWCNGCSPENQKLLKGWLRNYKNNIR